MGSWDLEKIERDKHTGWLSPDGLFIFCEPFEHMDMSGMLVNKFYPNESPMNPDQFLQNQGWIKISKFMGDLFPMYKDNLYFTYDQFCWFQPLVDDHEDWFSSTFVYEFEEQRGVPHMFDDFDVTEQADEIIGEDDLAAIDPDKIVDED